MKQRTKEILKIVSLPVIGASLCCLSPLILFVLGLASLSFAASLSDIFYHQYKWAFRLLGLVLLIVFLIIHFRKKGVCTLEQAKRQKNKIINTVLIALIAGVLGYLFFLYVVVHYLGVFLKIWK